jgi:hypothetical protein
MKAVLGLLVGLCVSGAALALLFLFHAGPGQRPTVRIIPGDEGPTLTTLSRDTDPEYPGVVLELTGRGITDALLERRLAEIRNTANSPVVLTLSYSNITDEGLKQVDGISTVKSLSLVHTRITRSGLQHLKWLPSLETLYLTGTRVGDDGLQELTKVRTLRSLYAGDTGLTDMGLSHVKDMKRLQLLDFAKD